MRTIQHQFLSALIPFIVTGCSCGKEKASRPMLKRNRDAAAVVVVPAPLGARSLIAEIEPNENREQAQQLLIPLGNERPTGIEGTMLGYQDTDFYTITTEETGYLFIELTGGSDVDYKLDLLDPAGVTVAVSDRGPASVSESIAGYRVGADTQYHVQVREFTKKKNRKRGGTGREGQSQPYRLYASLRDPTGNYEQEPNDGLENAHVIGEQERYGYVGWHNDVDLWRLSAAEFAERSAPVEGEFGDKETPVPTQGLDIVLSNIPMVATRLRLLDAIGTTLIEVRSKKGQETAIRNFVPETNSEWYFVQVGGKQSNGETPYRLAVSATELAPGCETEPNNTPLNASVLSDGVGASIVATGELSLGDVDFFRLAPSSDNRALDLRLTSQPGADLSLAILSDNGAVLASLSKAKGEEHAVLHNVNIGPGAPALLRVLAKTLVRPTPYTVTASIRVDKGVNGHPSALGGDSTNPDHTAP